MMTIAKTLACCGLCLITSIGNSEPLIKPTAIDWLLDCPLPAVERLNPEVVARTQCGIVTVPRNYAAPRQGSLRLSLTRVGARDPLSREGVVFAQPGDAPRTKSGSFVIELTSRWESYATPAYRKLLGRYDVIELSTRDLTHPNAVEHAARDMDYVRAQLGDAQLHYLGNASATRIGSHYGTLFPERVVRMVLVDAEHESIDVSAVQSLHLKEPAKPDGGGCINRWVGDFLAYGKQPPRSTRCLTPEG
ncbi:proteinase [Pseudomonas fluorescens ABAC62]|nr:proteinase [Pseudomonas fluorescens ABAC62]